jgi:hypothetical protein
MASFDILGFKKNSKPQDVFLSMRWHKHPTQELAGTIRQAVHKPMAESM